ncbi:hypothetical protein ABZ442_05130 [Streptomyces triculaminicus]|uniref:hypothetical protein n=1 Tax=Streptomyces triculaminicus TaxID=2816232 RepID=UPI0033F97A36
MKIDPGVADLIQQGLNNTQIASALGVSRVRVGDMRRALGVPNVSRCKMTLEERWASNTEAAADGHVVWTGERNPRGTPYLCHGSRMYTAYRVAFYIKHQHWPQGMVLPACEVQGCVAPDHVDDTEARQKVRRQLRFLSGGQMPAALCARGHDQDVHGRFEPDGTSYCNLCTRYRKHGEPS